ncbi:MAG: hypothetical protein M1825_003380 [Sarcosagium campestre]|nr:MAG: hypothetical protein M1825_003380 [Sarcosagium campestre]
MSFDRLPSLESQPTTLRREDDRHYVDDPDFQSLTQSLSNQLFTLTSNISRLSNQIALLGTKRDTERVRERVHNLLEETRDTFKEVGEGIKRMQAWEDVNKSQKYTQQKLSREFQASLSEFQTVQRSALEKQRASNTAARSTLSTSPTSPSQQHHGGFGDQQQQQQEQQSQQQEQEQLRLASQDEVDFQDSLIVERESEIRNIEQSVGELNELFRDVAHIVGVQGEQLDIISDNVQGVHTDTQGADRELRSASRHQRNARSKACCLLLVLAAVLAVILLAAFLG